MSVEPMLVVTDPFVELVHLWYAVGLEAIFKNQWDFVRKTLHERYPGIECLNHFLSTWPVTPTIYHNQEHSLGSNFVDGEKK